MREYKQPEHTLDYQIERTLHQYAKDRKCAKCDLPFHCVNDWPLLWTGKRWMTPYEWKDMG